MRKSIPTPEAQRHGESPSDPSSVPRCRCGSIPLSFSSFPRASRRLAARFCPPLFCAFLWLYIFSLGAAHAAEPIAISGRAMGTTWSAKFFQPVPPASALDPTAVTARIAATLEHLEAIFSTYRPSSELSRFNTSTSTNWIPVSPELARVAADSRRLSELTGGAFDATVAPLIQLWGFGPQRRAAHTLPTESEIAAARARVDYRRLDVRLAPPALRKTRADLSADFSSMAKGFASDVVSELLTTLGAPTHLVQVGGDIKTSGPHAWRTAIEQPLASPRAPHSVPAAPSVADIVTLSGLALSTSGDTHNFYAVAGQRYGHILDPRTGRPATGPLASVSVLHASCATSSALATALFVLGPDAGQSLALREGLAGLFLIRDRENESGLRRQTTPAFDRLSTLNSPP